MNHVYRLLWSDASLSFVVVAENAKSRGKRSGGGKAAVLLAGVMVAGGALAQVPLPGGAQVSSGQASISTAGATMTVNQGSAKAAINWNSFSIGKGATVNFVQPSSSSVVLNRVVGNERSVIDGALNANGQVFLLNSNGVLFNQGASVNTAGLVASTMALSDADFNASNYAFSNSGSTASVINFGAINIADGGYAALLGRQVSNQGTITARLGTVALAAGNKVSLNFSGNSLLNVTVDQGVLDALVENRSAILADGGQVVLTARAVDALMATVVNNTGEIRARTIANQAGKIYLLGGFDGGAVNVAGTLDASAPDGGAGGFIDTSGAHVKVVDGAMVSTLAASGATGNWLIDPNNYTIAASGGNITGTQLATSLNTSNVTISTATQGSGGGSGDIFVNDTIAKTGYLPTTLTLLAERNINFNNAVSSSGSRLNVVATADADNNATGNVVFNAGGSVTTNGGNFYAGAVSGNTASTRGQNFTMRDGSFINVGTGTLGIYAVNTVTLAGASLVASAAYSNYYNDGTINYGASSDNGVTISTAGGRGGIVNAAADTASANIIGTAGTTLIAGSIGTAAAPVTLAAPAGTHPGTLSSNHTLDVENRFASTYISTVGAQPFSDVNLTLASQANSVQNIVLAGDSIGGTGHILMTSNANGVFNLGTGAIDTSGVMGPGGAVTARPTTVTLNVPTMVFADNAVNTGTSTASYGATFTANGATSAAAAANGVADIRALAVTLNGNVGTAPAPVEMDVTNTLSLINTGSAYVSVLGAGPNTVNLTTSKNIGTQSIVFAGGDQINIRADGSKQAVGTIGIGSGIDLHHGNRALNWTQPSGYMLLDTNAIDLGSASFSSVSNGAENLGGATLAAVHARDDQAEITAGNVTLQMTSGSGGGISNIEIAKGGTASNNTLTIVNSGSGAIDMAELSAGHFKTLALTLNGTAAQNVRLGLYGADDIDLAFATSGVTLDATKVNLSGYNRNLSLSTAKAVQIDGVSFGTGTYSVTSSGRIALNSDVLTDGSAISLRGAAIQLLRSVRIDSNADDINHSASTGNAGAITLSGAISASAAGFALDVEAASSNANGGYISSSSAVGNGSTSAYLSGLRFNANGVNDGSVYLSGGSYLLNGDFTSVGYTSLSGAITIDTEQGNVGNAGNISFSGSSASASSSTALTFDASTTRAGFNGGNIDLAGTTSIGTFSGAAMTVKSTGGAGGSAGSITLPTVNTSVGRATGTQTYRGGVISLFGNLASNGGDILLDGAVRLAGGLSTTSIDTWSSSLTQAGDAGTVTFTGGVSAAAAGKALTIDTSVATGASFYNGTLDYTLAGGAVGLATGNAGGNYLAALTINTLASGTHNTGASGAIALSSGATTTGAQTYSGGTMTLGGDLATNGGNITFSNLAAVTLAATPLSFTTDMAGGSNAAGSINLGTALVKGASALTLDATADGGGLAGTLALSTLGTGAALASLQATGRAIAVNGAIASRGDILFETTGALTLNGAVASTTGKIVATVGSFTNNAGANALSAAAGKNWQVWSRNPAFDAPGALPANYKQYNAVYGTTAVLGTGNGLLYSLAPTVTAVLAGTVAKTYDGSAAATLAGANLVANGVVAGDTVTFVMPASVNYADANAASGKLVTADGIAIATVKSGAATVYGYQLAGSTATGAVGTIAAKALTVTGVGAATRVYDGTRAATLSGGTLTGMVGSETLGLGAVTGSYADKNVGTAKRVTVDSVLLQDGSGLASNYSVGSINPITGAVTARALDVSATGASRVYDGSLAATVTLGDNRVAGDSLAVASTGATFADKNAASGKTVTVRGITVRGADAANYTVNTTASTLADITARALQVSASAAGRVYDGSTAATVALLDNRVAGDSFTVNKSGANFADKNAASAKTVTVTGIALSGLDAANYSVNDTATATASITARALVVGASAASRVYDGSRAAAVTLLDNRVAGDSLSATSTGATFADKNAATGKAVSVTGIAIAGADAANYTVNTTATTRADITARALAVAASAASRVYDGGMAATVTLADDRVAGDSLAVTSTGATFADKNAASGKAVNVTGIRATGADAANYAVSTTATTTADITARALTVAASGVNRVYDGSTLAAVTLQDNRVAGDSLVLSNRSATFADKNAGAGKTVSVDGIALGGLDAGNYTVNGTATTRAAITARALAVSATGIGRIYDGSLGATVTLQDNRVAGDTLSVTGQGASFLDKNAASGKTVTVRGIDVQGADAANYTANTTATTTADITARALLASATGIDRVYDGSTVAAVTLQDDRVAGDSLVLGNSGATFFDKNAGTGKTVSVNGIAASGLDAANYTVNATAITSAAITARALQVAANGIDRVYDGSTAASVTLLDNRVAGDSLLLSNSGATFADKNAGAGKAVSVSGVALGGLDAANYTVNGTATTSAAITARALAVTAAGIGRVYDGSTAAAVTLLDNRVAGDSVNVTASGASFADKNAASGKAVTVNGIAIDGLDAANYTVNRTASTSADITARALQVAATGIDRVYDGSTVAAVTLQDDRVAGDSLVLGNGSATFLDKNAGAGKTVSVSGIAIDGVDAGNYTANTTAVTSAGITARALVVAASGIDRVYDGSTFAAVTLQDNRVAGDSLALSNTGASFADKHTGAGKAVGVTGIAISGIDAANYTANTTAATSAAVTARALVVAATGANRVYDGSTAAGVTLLDNRVAGDSVIVAASGASFADKNAASGKAVTVTGIAIYGVDAANYTVNAMATTSADITARALTVGASGIDRVYDGSITAAVTLQDNRVAGDSLAVIDSSATFADKNAGTGKTVSIDGIAITGVDAANYVVNATATTSAAITARALLVAASGVNRVYDGSTVAAVTLLDNRVAGDSLVLRNSAATFADKNAGAGKAVSVEGIAVTGTDAANYTFNTTATTSAAITARALAVAATGTSRVYDGSLAATVTLQDNRVAGDDLAVSTTGASFADKNTGAGKAVSIRGIAIGGRDAANYTVASTASATADITARALAVTASGIDRVYDGSTSAAVTLRDNRVAGDVLAVTTSSASFLDKNAGAGKTVQVQGIAIGGADAGNYIVNDTATTSAGVTARALRVTASADSKLYSGSTLASVTLADDRLAGDTFNVSAAAANFADANPGANKTVTVTGIRLDGPDAANYAVDPTASTRANLTSNAALDSTIGAVTNNNAVTAALTPAAATPGRSGFVITAPMQPVLPDAVRQGSYVDAVMAPATGQAGVPLPQSALAQLVRPGADGVLRVRLQQHGVASIVDGGVRLPDGVAQQFFIVPAQASVEQ